MKAIVFAAVLFLISFGSAWPQSNQLTQQQKEQIKSQIKVVCDSMIAQMERLDTIWVQYWSDSPDWMCINTDGSRWDFQTFKKFNIDFASDSMSAWTWTTDLQNFPLITDQMVVCSWIGHDQVSLKSGDKLIYNPDAYTFIFRKVAGNWKVFYTQESATVTTQKAEKK